MQPPSDEHLEARLDRWLAEILPRIDTAEVAARAAIEADEAERLLAIYANEARVGLRLIHPLLRPGMRVLEIGSGIGALLNFLHSEGVDIVGIEPGGSGFGFMPAMNAAIAAAAGGSARCLVIGAEELDQAHHGGFDLIFSTNVIEHIPDLDSAFRGMARVLAHDGMMVHACPNYAIPYEPHFGIPLVPLCPRLTRHIVPGMLTRYPGLWAELNFVTARRVRRIVRGLGLAVTFDRDVLHDVLTRISEDDEFSKRQGRLGRVVRFGVRNLGLDALLKRVPGGWLTPMIFRVSRKHLPN